MAIFFHYQIVSRSLPRFEYPNKSCTHFIGTKGVLQKSGLPLSHPEEITGVTQARIETIHK